MSEPGISGKDQVSSKTNPNFQHVNLVVIKCSLVQRRKVFKTLPFHHTDICNIEQSKFTWSFIHGFKTYERSPQGALQSITQTGFKQHRSLCKPAKKNDQSFSGFFSCRWWWSRWCPRLLIRLLLFSNAKYNLIIQSSPSKHHNAFLDGSTRWKRRRISSI